MAATLAYRNLFADQFGNKMQGTRMPKETMQICFEIDSHLASLLQSTANLCSESLDSVINSIIINYFEQAVIQFKESGQENRKYPRKCVSIPAVIEIEMNDSETQYKPVKIVNISRGGVGIEIQSGSSLIMERLDQKSNFVIIFYIPSLSDVVRIICTPVRISRDSISTIGAAFQGISSGLRKSLGACLGIS